MIAAHTPHKRLPDDFEIRRAKLREAAAKDAALAADVKSQRVAAAVRAAALNPPQGWWRKPLRAYPGVARVLRRDVVFEALSVGCSAREIREASGASMAQWESARVACQAFTPPDTEPAPALDWLAILTDAVERRLSLRDVARAHRVSCYTAQRQRDHYGFRSVKRGRRWRLVAPAKGRAR